MRVVVAVIVAVVLVAAAVPASAMTFKFGTTGDGLRVVVASGEIKQADARRRVRALAEAGRDRHGTKRLYLDSPGGAVSEAMKMAEVMKAEGVSAIVRKGAVCASACASVLFVSGRYRTVEEGGALAIHGCYNALSGRPATGCNAAISAHADSVGVSGLTMMVLQEAAGADAVLYFDAENAACFGLTLKPGARPSNGTPPCMAEALRGTW